MKRILRVAATAALMLGCVEAPQRYSPYEPEPGTPEAIAYEGGLTRHLGAALPREEAERAGGVTTFTFDPADGPVCMRGAAFRASIRETESEDLLIFLQGGGACWSDFCLAVTTAPAGIPRTDLLRNDPENPLGGWDVLYVPYCDGSLFAGERDVDEDGDGEPDRFHRGLANLSAALSVAALRFPSPRRIVLAGSSGGGFGTILAAYLVRYVYPGVPIDVLNDAGLGVARGDDPAFVGRIIDDFGARDFIPNDCEGCIDDGHITELVRHLLDRDPQVRVAAISSWYDYIISQVFLMSTPDAFRDALDAETTALHEAHPERYRRFIFDGEAHTALLGNVSGIVGSDLGSVELPADAATLLSRVEIASMYERSIDGVTLASWIGAMVSQGDAWRDLVEPAGDPPPLVSDAAP